MLEEPKALYGLYQMKKAKKALNNLANWNPTFRSGDSILNEATSKTPSGYTPQQEAAFNSNLTRLNNQKFRMASQANPNLSANVRAGIDFGNIAALNEFAKNDAILKNQKINTLATTIRGQDNANVTNQISQKAQMEQAYGNAYRAGLGNIVGALDSKINDLKTVASFVIPGAGAGAGGGDSSAEGQQSLGQMAAGSATPTMGAGAGFGNKAAAGYQAPINNSWKPYDTPVAPYTMPPNPYPMQGWITNPNQFRP